MKYLLLLKFWIKKTFNLPIYRKDILERIKLLHNDYSGLCGGIKYTLCYFNINRYYYIDICKYIPKFGVNISKFNVDVPNLHNIKFKNVLYWWDKNIWTTGRLDYLNWLINEYKDDKTNLRKL